MYCGLRYESTVDMPPRMREQAERKLMEQEKAKRKRQALEKAEKTAPVAGVQEAAGSSKTKYHNRKTEVDGIKFDSLKESRRFCQLKMAMELGVIEELRLQVDFTLIEAYTDAKGERHQALRYKADFTYKVRSAGYDHMAQLGYEDIEYWRGLWPGALVIEDVKSEGTKTGVYINKKKMMADMGYQIREV